MDAADAQALELIRGLPENATIAWAAGGHFSLREPFRKGWVDVYAKDICEPVGWNWGWTIEQPDNPDPIRGVFDLRADYDAQLEMLLDDPYQGGTPRQARLRLDDGRLLDLSYLLDEDEWAEYRDRGGDDWEQQRGWYWMSWQGLEPCTILNVEYPPTATLSEIDGEMWVVCRVWTPAAVSRGLQGWCAGLGRPDLRFTWDPELRTPKDDMIASAHETLSAYRRGEISSTVIGEGVAALAPAMDWLLSLPAEEAAKVTGALQDLQRRAAADEQARLDAWLDTLTDEGREAYLAGDLEPPAHIDGE